MQIKWELLTIVPNAPLAHALVDSLAADGVVTNFVSDTTLLGEARTCRVFIDSTHIHRARWLLAQRNFSDEELVILATASQVDSEQ
jgi:hypothetical protein